MKKTKIDVTKFLFGLDGFDTILSGQLYTWLFICERFEAIKANHVFVLFCVSYLEYMDVVNPDVHNDVCDCIEKVIFSEVIT